ncbi:MAG: PEP-CTERM sorting domain-containing protein [Acidobacteriia bacterium]|nr:PEP-CTERM sorting domain-containing protein [Terriglobia bacterium]
MKNIWLLWLVVLLVSVPAPILATTTVWNNEASFVAAIQPGYYLKDLVGMTVQSGFNPGPASLAFGPTKGFSWNVTVGNAYSDSTGFFEVPAGLSTWFSYDVMTFSFVGSPTPVTAVGGTFFANDNSGNTVASMVEGLLNDGTKVTLTKPGFGGFTSDVGISSLKVWSIDGISQHVDGTTYAGVGELYVGSIPEPATITLIGAGLLGLGILGRRRRRSTVVEVR